MKRRLKITFTNQAKDAKSKPVAVRVLTASQWSRHYAYAVENANTHQAAIRYANALTA